MTDIRVASADKCELHLTVDVLGTSVRVRIVVAGIEIFDIFRIDIRLSPHLQVSETSLLI